MKTIHKKFCLFVTAVALISGSVFAQETTTTTTTTTTNSKKMNDNDFPRLELGIRFMPTFSSLNVTNVKGDAIRADAVLGYGYGGMLGVNFTPYVGMQGEVIYTSVSQKYTDNSDSRTITLNYINVPMLLSLNTGKQRMVNLNFVVGPQVGLNVGSKLEMDESSDPDEPKAVLAVKQNDLGFAYGAGLEFSLLPSHLLRLDVGFRGVYGLLDISDNSKTQSTDSYYILDKTRREMYSGYLGLTLGF